MAPRLGTQITGYIAGVRHELMVADTPETRATGLMHVTSLPENTGMLFVFDKPGYYPFWMKNTYLPLDLIYLNSNYRVVDLVHGMGPESEVRHVNKNEASFAIELNAGAIDKLGLKSNSRVVLIPTANSVQ